MTINKSLISIAAATLLVAGFTGCGSSSGSSSTTTTTTTTPSTTTGIQSAVQAVDGYVFNAKVEAWYLGEDNKTMKKVTLSGTDSTKDTVSLKWTEGSAKYSLPTDANDTVKNGLRFFKLTGKGSTTTGTTYTPATYIETGASGVGQDANDTTLPTTFVMYAPANGAILSPLSNLIYQATKAVLGSETAFATAQLDLNITTLASIEGNATKIAKNLGLSSVDLLTADPVSLETSNPTLRLVNALLKTAAGATATQMTSIAASIANATAATDLATTLTVIKAALTAGGQDTTLVSDLETKAKAGTFTTDDVAKLNIEKSVEDKSYTSKTVANNKGVFPVDSITINGVDFETLNDGAKGNKIKNDVITVDFNMSNVADTNISNTSFELLVKLDGDKDYASSSDNNSATALVFSVPFDMNLTSKVLKPSIKPTATIAYEARTGTGSAIVSKTDLNASLATVEVGTSKEIEVVSSTTLRFDIAQMITDIVTYADANITGSIVGTDIADKISNIQIALVAPSGTMTRVSSDGKQPLNFPSATFASIAGTINGTGIKVLELTEGDFRGTTTTEANAAPAQKLTITNNGGGGTVDNPFILNNNNAFNGSLAGSAIQSFETNSTFSIISEGDQAALITDKNSSYINTVLNNAVDVSGPSAALNVFEVNTTSKTVGELNSTIEYKVTDEFGESNTSKMYVRINRAPVKATYKEYNTSAILIAEDYDGDSNLGMSGTSATTLGNAITGSSKDVNISSIVTNIPGKLVLDFNDTITGLDINISATGDINESTDNNLTAFDINITL